MCGAAIAASGTLLPWIGSIPANIDFVVTRSIFSPALLADLPGVDGQAIAALALFSFLMGILLWVGRRRDGAAVVALVLAVVAGVTVVADYLDARASLDVLRTTYFVVAQVGIGVYVTAAGVAIWSIGCVFGYLAGRAPIELEVTVQGEADEMLGDLA